MDKTHLLIVEDDLDLAEMLHAYFRVQNYEVLTAAWGEDALKMSREHEIDLIVLDIRLPDIDGYEVCRRLRLQRRTQDTPIIFLTEKRDRVDKLQGLELGVVDYITKPFDIQELRLRIRNAITRAKEPALVNPVTNLPEGQPVDEKLTALLSAEGAWTVLHICVSSLSKFREMYGFVAADDVLRAITLMIRNAVREHGNPGDYVGHLDAEDFIIITSEDKTPVILERVTSRLEQSREYFYPLKDREKAREAMETHALKIASGIVGSKSGPFQDLAALKKALTEATAAGDTAKAEQAKEALAEAVASDKGESEETTEAAADSEADDKAAPEKAKETTADSETGDKAAPEDTPDEKKAE